MGPLRLIILAVLLYIGYRLIVNSFKKKGPSQDEETTSERTGKITDVLVECSVCQKLVPQKQAHQVQDGDDVHLLCSQECADKFRSEKGDRA